MAALAALQPRLRYGREANAVALVIYTNSVSTRGLLLYSVGSSAQVTMIEFPTVFDPQSYCYELRERYLEYRQGKVRGGSSNARE